MPAAASSLKQEMRKARSSDVGCRVAVARLIKLGYMESNWPRGDNYDGWVAYRLTEEGENWLIENQAKLELRTGRARNQVVDFESAISGEDANSFSGSGGPD